MKAVTGSSQYNKKMCMMKQTLLISDCAMGTLLISDRAMGTPLISDWTMGTLLISDWTIGTLASTYSSGFTPYLPSQLRSPAAVISAKRLIYFRTGC